MGEQKRSRRGDYPHFQVITTRWMDNDIYGHVNNVVYYSYFDTIINDYLIREGGLDIQVGEVIGVCAESSCRFKAAFSFPEAIQGGLRVAELRTRAVRYEIALFKAGASEAAAEGSFVHVFVQRETMRPVEIPLQLRGALERLVL